MHKLFIILAFSLAACVNSVDKAKQSPEMEYQTLALPAGYTVVEQSPDGYFIRLASAERADAATIRAIADTYSDKFDRIDLCLDVAHERGDEYTSIIGHQVFDHENDTIYSLNPVSK